MKRITLCFILLFALLGISLAGIFHLKGCTETLSVALDEIIDDMKSGNAELAYQKTEEAKDFWEENNVYTFVYINQEKLFEIDSCFAKILGQAKENSDEAISECLSLKTYISLLYHTQLPILENIF